MDEFRKEYEYTEEKRGLILFFVIMLVSIDIFLSISLSVQVHNFLKHIPALGISIWVISILFVIFLLFTAITCYTLKRNLVTISKAYLIVRTIFAICCIIVIYVNIVNDDSMIANGARQYKSLSELNLRVLVAPLLYQLVFSGAWYLYFSKSKKCKEIEKKTFNM